MQETGQQKVTLALMYHLVITIAYSFLPPAVEIVFIKNINAPSPLLILSTRVRPGNCATAMVKGAGTAAAFKQVWPFPWKMEGIGEFFVTRILHHSPDDFAATFLDLAIGRGTRTSRKGSSI